MGYWEAGVDLVVEVQMSFPAQRLVVVRPQVVMTQVRAQEVAAAKEMVGAQQEVVLVLEVEVRRVQEMVTQEGMKVAEMVD